MTRLVASGKLSWRDLLLDAQAGVRASAQAAALDSGALPDDEYRARLASPRGPRLAYALAGLGETGGAADVPLVKSFLYDQPVAVRAATLRALARLRADDLLALALGALDDPSAAVAWQASEIACARASELRAEDVWSAFATARGHGRRTALAVIARLENWAAAIHLLRAFVAADATLEPRVVRYLRRWLARQTRVFVAPNAAQRAELLPRLAAAHALPRPLRDELSAQLTSRGR